MPHNPRFNSLLPSWWGTGKTPSWLMLAVLMSLFCATQARAGDVEKSLHQWASFSEPAGWAKTEFRNPGGPTLRFRKDVRTLSIRWLGDKESEFSSVEDYMKSLQARGLMHPNLSPPEDGKLNVGGNEVTAYRVSSFVPIGDPHVLTPKPLRLPVEETFVIVPAGGPFFVLKFAVEGLQSPKREDRENQAVEWLAFLRSFRLKNKPE